MYQKGYLGMQKKFTNFLEDNMPICQIKLCDPPCTYDVQHLPMYADQNESRDFCNATSSS